MCSWLVLVGKFFHRDELSLAFVERFLIIISKEASKVVGVLR